METSLKEIKRDTSLEKIGLNYNPFSKSGRVTKPEDVKVFWCNVGENSYKMKIDEWLGSPNVILIRGTVGLGKTHTLFYIKKYIEDSGRDFFCIYNSYLEIKRGFIEKIIEQLKSSQLHKILKTSDKNNKDPYDEINKIIESLFTNKKKVILMIDQFEDIFQDNKIINIEILQELRYVVDYSEKYGNPMSIFIGTTDDAWEACIKKYEALRRRHTKEDLILIDKLAYLKGFTSLYLNLARKPGSEFNFGTETLREILKRTGGREDRVIVACHHIITKIAKLKLKDEDLADKKIKELAKSVFKEGLVFDVTDKKEKIKKKTTQITIEPDADIKQKVFEILKLINKINICPPSIESYQIDNTKNIYALKLSYPLKFKGKWNEVFIECVDDDEKNEEIIEKNKEGFTFVISSAEEKEGENYKIIPFNKIKSIYQKVRRDIITENEEIIKGMDEDQIVNHPAVTYLLSKKLGLFE